MFETGCTGCTGTKRIHANLSMTVTPPPSGSTSFDRYNRERTENTLLVLAALFFEQFPTWHTDNTYIAHFSSSFHARLNFPNQSQPKCRPHWHFPTNNTHLSMYGTWTGRVGQSNGIRTTGFIAISWTNDQMIGHGTQRTQSFNWLVRGSILTESDGIVCHDINDTGKNATKK